MRTDRCNPAQGAWEIKSRLPCSSWEWRGGGGEVGGLTGTREGGGESDLQCQQQLHGVGEGRGSGQAQQAEGAEEQEVGEGPGQGQGVAGAGAEVGGGGGRLWELTRPPPPPPQVLATSPPPPPLLQRQKKRGRMNKIETAGEEAQPRTNAQK